MPSRPAKSSLPLQLLTMLITGASVSAVSMQVEAVQGQQ